jgi:hypothetical protein
MSVPMSTRRKSSQPITSPAYIILFEIGLTSVTELEVFGEGRANVNTQPHGAAVMCFQSIVLRRSHAYAIHSHENGIG